MTETFTSPRLFGATYRITFRYPAPNNHSTVVDIWAQNADDAVSIWRVQNENSRRHPDNDPRISSIQMLGPGQGPFPAPGPVLEDKDLRSAVQDEIREALGVPTTAPWSAVIRSIKAAKEILGWDEADGSLRKALERVALECDAEAVKLREEARTDRGLEALDAAKVKDIRSKEWDKIAYRLRSLVGKTDGQ